MLRCHGLFGDLGEIHDILGVKGPLSSWNEAVLPNSHEGMYSHLVTMSLGSGVTKQVNGLHNVKGQ